MLLRVENLGPVRKAELDLSKDLIVLTGPNNTGKTYLTWAVYGLVPPARGDLKYTSELRRLIDASLEAHTDGQSVVDITVPVHAIEASIAEGLVRRLPDVFASSSERFQGASASVSFAAEELEEFKHHPGFESSGQSYQVQFDEARRCVNVRGQGMASEDDIAHLRLWGPYIFDVVILGDTLGFGTVVFPVERLAINLFARELAANRTQLVDEMLEKRGDSHDLLRRRAGRYPRAIRDALQRALKLQSGEKSEFADLADELERDVLGGKLSKTEFDEIEFTPDGQAGAKPLGLHQSASVIKSLASLVWHLRYEAVAGQRLIIDEPELNLHPDNQRRVARALAKAVNRGLKVMMSTHSDYVVRELNNLIMLSQDSDEARGLVREMGIDPMSTIKPDKLGVYFVHEGECQAVPVTETGFEVKTIDDEVHRLNRDAQTIYSRLFVD